MKTKYEWEAELYKLTFCGHVTFVDFVQDIQDDARKDLLNKLQYLCDVIYDEFGESHYKTKDINDFLKNNGRENWWVK